MKKIFITSMMLFGLLLVAISYARPPTAPQSFNNISLIAVPSSDHTASGITDIMTIDSGAGSSYGNALYLVSDGEWDLADASDATKLCMGLAIEDGVGSKKILKYGRYRDDTWNWTVGGAGNGFIYLSETAGALTQTAPTTSGSVTQIIGIAETADIAFFFFSPWYTVHS